MYKNKKVAVSVVTAVIMLACACPVSGLLPTDDQPAQPGLTPGLPTILTLPPTPNVPKILITTNPATQPPIPDSIDLEPGKIIYTDDFSTPSPEMESYSDDNGIVETRDGVYVVQSTNDVWNWGNSISEFSDIVIEFDATLVQAPSNHNAGIGVICRLIGREDDSIDGYMFAISGDGYYSISIAEAGTLNPLIDWTPSNVINTGKTTNHVRATCNGSELYLEVNGQLIANTTAVNANLTPGTFAFAAISYEETEPVAEVHFDNLTISEP